MTITALPTPPLRSDPTSFASRGDAFLAALPTFAEEANALAAAMNLNSTTDASASGVLIGTGVKTFTVTAGKSFQPGMYLVIADAAAPSANSMWGQITSYSGTSLVVNIIAVRGSGTKTSWVISQSAPGGAAAGENTDITSLANIASINGGQLAGMRNRIINGGFAVNQRDYASGMAVGAGLYGHDRWKMAASEDTYTYSTTNNKTTVTIPAGKVLRQVVEGLNLETGTYCLSWQGTAQGKIGAGAYGASGITGAITGGTNTTIEFGPGTVSNVQLELGSVATLFEQRPYGLELMLCQRYHETGQLSACGDGVMAYVSASSNYLASKRAAPTLVVRDNIGAAGKCSVDAANGVSAVIGGGNIHTFRVNVENVVIGLNAFAYFNYTASAEL